MLCFLLDKKCSYLLDIHSKNKIVGNIKNIIISEVGMFWQFLLSANLISAESKDKYMIKKRANKLAKKSTYIYFWLLPPNLTD